jgi:hypothetical protein
MGRLESELAEAAILPKCLDRLDSFRVEQPPRFCPFPIFGPFSDRGFFRQRTAPGASAVFWPVVVESVKYSPMKLRHPRARDGPGVLERRRPAPPLHPSLLQQSFQHAGPRAQNDDARGESRPKYDGETKSSSDCCAAQTPPAAAPALGIHLHLAPGDQARR